MSAVSMPRLIVSITEYGFKMQTASRSMIAIQAHTNALSYLVITALVRLEPCDGKLSCAVLRGLGTGNRPWLLDYAFHDQGTPK